MRGAADSMAVRRPGTVARALAMLASEPDALPLAGGTDIMVAWNMGALNKRVVLDLSALKSWSRIQRADDCLTIGSLVTHAALERHPIVQRRFGLLVEACRTIGGVQIQNRGTIGGNVANASPAADTFPALAVYDARIRVARASGRRMVPFMEIFAGPKRTTLQPGELIEAIELPFAARPPDLQIFRKVGTRAAQAISKTVLAGVVWLSPDRTVAEARLALGSMAPAVRRLHAAEQYLAGRLLTPGVVREAAELVSSDVAPIDDMRSTAAYRLAVSQRLIEGFLLGAA
jgi:xanthine dehydrogenase small subunit